MLPERKQATECRSVVGDDMIDATDEAAVDAYFRQVGRAASSGPPPVGAAPLLSRRELLRYFAEQQEAVAELGRGKPAWAATTRLALLTHGVAPPLEGLRPITIADGGCRGLERNLGRQGPLRPHNIRADPRGARVS